MPRKESTKRNDKKCEKCSSAFHAGNDPSWYTREGLSGYVGANFAALSTIDDIILNKKYVRTNTGLRFLTMVGCPTDLNGSFMKMMNLMYAEIREKNSGAANYNPRILGAYVHDLMTIRALYIHACRTMAAVRSSQAGSADSPYYLAGVVSRDTYKNVADNLANYTNALRLIGKDISVLPLPHIAMFDREEFLYGRVFADSKTNKAAMMAFVPYKYVRRLGYDTSKGEYTYGVTLKDAPSAISGIITVLQEMLTNIATNPTITILRGDLIKAFGYSSVDISSYVDKPLVVEFNQTVLSQIENMNVLYQNVVPTEEVVGSQPTGNVYLAVQSQNTLAIPQRCDDEEWMINFHDSMTPDSGTLLAITRNMAYKNGAGAKLYTSGDPVLEIEYLTGINTAQQTVNSSMLSLDISNIESTTQSEAEEALRQVANIASIVDGFPWVWTGKGDERTNGAYIWDVDQWAIVNMRQLEQMNEIAIRSLFYCRAPRPDGMIKAGRL